MRSNPDIRGGILCIDKPEGFTSQDAVNKIRRFYGTRQVGHTGTLDPMATGVLLVLVGRAVKASEYLMTEKKTYTAKIRFGASTDTEDTSGSITATTEKIPTREEILSVLPDFIGDVKQVPPMYSALKRNGRKLVDLARSGIEIEREARDIHIDSIELTDGEGDEYTLSVTCSKGTYIRTLCADIGTSAGSLAAMSYLRRTENGGYRESDAHTLSEIESMSEEERFSLLIPIENAFLSYPKAELSAFFERLIRNGVPIETKRLNISLPVGSFMRIYGEEGFFALGSVCEKSGVTYLKSEKFL